MHDSSLKIWKFRREIAWKFTNNRIKFLSFFFIYPLHTILLIIQVWQVIHRTRALSWTALVTSRYDIAIPVFFNRVQLLSDDPQKAVMNSVEYKRSSVFTNSKSTKSWKNCLHHPKRSRCKTDQYDSIFLILWYGLYIYPSSPFICNRIPSKLLTASK